MKSSPGTLAFGLLLSVAIPSGVALAVDASEQLMLERADYWRSQQRPDLAGNILNKLLAVNPSQPDALYQQGVLALAGGDRADAERYFDRLRLLAATSSRAARLAATLKALPPPTASAPAVPATATAVAIAAVAQTGAVATEIADAPAATESSTAAPMKTAAASSADSDDLAPATPRSAPRRAPPHASASAADSDDLIPGRPTAPTNGPDRQLPRTPAVAVLPEPARLQRVAASQQTVSDGDTTVPPTPEAARSSGSADLGDRAKAVQVAQVELQPPPPINGYQHEATLTYSPDDTLEMQIDRNLETIESQTNPTLIAGLGFRGHSGDDGLNRLNEVGASFEGSFSPWYTGTARVAVLPVYLDANGAVSSSELGEFGANPILAARGATLVPSGLQEAAGVGILGSYTYRDLSAEFGTTPLGFPVTNLIGNLAYTPKFFNDTLSVRFEGLRQPVTDSVLSYAGTHASIAAANGLTGGAFGSNPTWGGVVKTGGRVTVYYDDQTFWGAYGGAGLSAITGTNVAQNSSIDALLGAYFRPWKTDDWSLRIGISAFFASYDKNLSGFTFGQGGYFSPQSYEVLTFPVEYTGHSGPWSWLASAAIGVQHFNADSSPIFPNNAFAQTALASTPGSVAILGGTEDTGPAFNFKGQIEYQVDPTLAFGASASIDNSNNYVEGIGKIYLRKTFDWFAPIAKTDAESIAARDLPMSRL